MPPEVTRSAVAWASVFSQSANRAASARCLVFAEMAVEDPPQLPVRWSPALRWGSGAIAHLPWVEAALPARTPGPHTALGQASSVPSLSAWFHAGVYIGCLSTAPAATRPLQ